MSSSSGLSGRPAQLADAAPRRDEPAMQYRLEVVVVPVSDVDRAKHFYADQLGFPVDVDHAPNVHFRVIQMTPTGSG